MMEGSFCESVNLTFAFYASITCELALLGQFCILVGNYSDITTVG